MTSAICPEERCTGCNACANICPKECISMISRSEGFLYPEIDLERCDHCGACRCVCPILHPVPTALLAASHVVACWNRDEPIRFQSTSGGAFSALADQILDSGGVVFGAAFDEEMRVRHIAVQRKENLGRLRGSKYIQSDIARSYVEARNILRQNRSVLFSGTPCQIAGLSAFIGEENGDLVTCDVICHGVSSPGLFARYVDHLERRFRAKLVHISFRHKLHGWHLPSTMASFKDGRERVLTDLADAFMYGFINDLTLRPACYSCPYANVDRISDVTLGDFWGIGDLAPFSHPTRNGVSLVLVNSERGRQLLAESAPSLYCEDRSLEEAKHKHDRLRHPACEPMHRHEVFIDYLGLDYEQFARRHLVDKNPERLIKRIVPRAWLLHLRETLGRLERLLVRR
jgi:coenzyme F420-reducing hydrogenase beta subunit